jgi:hypothetical protein
VSDDMASKRGSDSGSSLLRFGGALLYYATVLVLIVAIAFMYKTWNDRKKQYKVLVQEASLDDHAYAIELQKERVEPEETSAEEAVAEETPAKETVEEKAPAEEAAAQETTAEEPETKSGEE